MIPIFLRQIAAGAILLVGFIIAAFLAFTERVGGAIGILLIFTFISTTIAPHPSDSEEAMKRAQDFNNSRK